MGMATNNRLWLHTPVPTIVGTTPLERGLLTAWQKQNYEDDAVSTYSDPDYRRGHPSREGTLSKAEINASPWPAECCTHYGARQRLQEKSLDFSRLLCLIDILTAHYSRSPSEK